MNTEVLEAEFTVLRLLHSQLFLFPLLLNSEIEEGRCYTLRPRCSLSAEHEMKRVCVKLSTLMLISSFEL